MNCPRCGAYSAASTCPACGFPTPPQGQQAPIQPVVQPMAPAYLQPVPVLQERPRSHGLAWALLGAVVALVGLLGVVLYQRGYIQFVSNVPVLRTAPVVENQRVVTVNDGSTGSSGSSVTTSYPDVYVPRGSKECSRSGSGPYAAAGTANPTTSCPFAINVRDAYLNSGLNGSSGQVVAYSPVTKITYTMDCSGDQPVLCTGGVRGRVVIYGGRLVRS